MIKETTHMSVKFRLACFMRKMDQCSYMLCEAMVDLTLYRQTVYTITLYRRNIRIIILSKLKSVFYYPLNFALNRMPPALRSNKPSSDTISYSPSTVSITPKNEGICGPISSSSVAQNSMNAEPIKEVTINASSSNSVDVDADSDTRDAATGSDVGSDTSDDEDSMAVSIDENEHQSKFHCIPEFKVTQFESHLGNHCEEYDFAIIKTTYTSRMTQSVQSMDEFQSALDVCEVPVKVEFICDKHLYSRSNARAVALATKLLRHGFKLDGVIVLSGNQDPYTTLLSRDAIEAVETLDGRFSDDSCLKNWRAYTVGSYRVLFLRLPDKPTEYSEHSDRIKRFFRFNSRNTFSC